MKNKQNLTLKIIFFLTFFSLELFYDKKSFSETKLSKKKPSVSFNLKDPQDQSKDKKTKSNENNEASNSSKKKKRKSQSSLKFSEADPEDITNENFPDIIESFDYPNTPISEIINAISKLTKKNFIIDSGIGNQKISIIAPSPITVAEAYKVFLSALAMNDLTVVPTEDGKFLKIRKTKSALSDSIEMYSGAYFPRTDQLITYMFKLKHISTKNVKGNVKTLLGSHGKVLEHTATNALIVTGYGSNIEKINLILKKLDVPGFEEKMEVIRIFYANSEEISNLITKIFPGKGQKRGEWGRFGSSRYSSKKKKTKDDDERDSFSLVTSDKRTNSIIVVGTPSGIKKVRKLIKKLDVEVDPETGGIFVYYVRYGEAKQIADVLNGVISARSELKKDKESSSKNPLKTSKSRRTPEWANQNTNTTKGDSLFKENVKIVPDETNNSLIITGDRQDHNGIRSLLSKLDIPRDQVFVRVIILDMDINDTLDWGVNYYSANQASIPLAGRNPNILTGFGSKNPVDLLNPEGVIGATAGLVLGFGRKEPLFSGEIAGQKIEIKNLIGLVNFLKIKSNATILSRPQVMVMDNEEAIIEFGEEVPTGNSIVSLEGGNLEGETKYKQATTKLKFTPFISSENNFIRMKIEQTNDQPIRGDSNTVTSFKKRSLNSTIIVKSGDTAVLGGLISDHKEESVSKVPFLGDLPLIGWLFKGKGKKSVKRNVYAFITPKIIRSSLQSQNLLESRIKILEKDTKATDQKKKSTQLKKLIQDFQSGSEEEFIKESVSKTRIEEKSHLNKQEEDLEIEFEKEDENSESETNKEEDNDFVYKKKEKEGNKNKNKIDA